MKLAFKAEERVNSLLNEKSSLFMEVFETVGLIQICFYIDTDLQSCIDDLYNLRSLDIGQFPKTFNDEDGLYEYYEERLDTAKNFVNVEYAQKFDKLVNLLRAKLDSIQNQE